MCTVRILQLLYVPRYVPMLLSSSYGLEISAVVTNPTLSPPAATAHRVVCTLGLRKDPVAFTPKNIKPTDVVPKFLSFLLFFFLTQRRTLLPLLLPFRPLPYFLSYTTTITPTHINIHITNKTKLVSFAHFRLFHLHFSILFSFSYANTYHLFFVQTSL